MPEKRIRVKLADGNKRYGKIGRKRKYLLALGVFHLNWSQQERRAETKTSGLQCLAGQIIQIVHGRQAEG